MMKISNILLVFLVAGILFSHSHNININTMAADNESASDKIQNANELLLYYKKKFVESNLGDYNLIDALKKDGFECNSVVSNSVNCRKTVCTNFNIFLLSKAKSELFIQINSIDVPYMGGIRPDFSPNDRIVYIKYPTRCN